MPTKQSKAIERDFESTGAAGLTTSPAKCGVLAADFTALLVKHWKSLSLIQVQRSLVPEVESGLFVCQSKRIEVKPCKICLSARVLAMEADADFTALLLI